MQYQDRRIISVLDWLCLKEGGVHIDVVWALISVKVAKSEARSNHQHCQAFKPQVINVTVSAMLPPGLKGILMPEP